MLDHRRKTSDLIRFPNFTKVFLPFSSTFISISFLFFFFFNIRFLPAVEQIFPQDIYHLLGAISAATNFRRKRTSRSFSTNLQFILPLSPSVPEIVSILTRFTIAPRLKSCLMHSIDSQSKLDEQSARSNNDVIGYFARDARMERIFHGKRVGGGREREWTGVVID